MDGLASRRKSARGKILVKRASTQGRAFGSAEAAVGSMGFSWEVKGAGRPGLGQDEVRWAQDGRVLAKRVGLGSGGGAAAAAAADFKGNSRSDYINRSFRT